MMNLPNQAVVVGSNEVLKQIWRNYNFSHNSFTYFGCASIAGMCAAFATMPLDNIKTRMNTQCNLFIKKACTETLLLKELPVSSVESVICECVEARGRIKYKDIIGTFKYICKEEGFKGFYKGFTPKVVTQSFSTAISWTVYEAAKSYLKGESGKK